MIGEIEVIWYIQQSLILNVILLNMRGFQIFLRDYFKNVCDLINIVIGYGILKKYKKIYIYQV